MFSRGFYLTVAAVLLVGGAILLGARLMRPRAERDDMAYIPRKEVITPEITLLQQYVRIDTSNPPGNEIAGARFLEEQLRKAGIASEIIESSPGRANLYARLAGRRPGEGLLLLHHIDVVPADSKQWARPPFSGEIHLNNLYGRGSLDMKSIGIAQLLAFIELAKSGRQPERDVVLLATADEEEGSEAGMEWLVRNRPDIFSGIRYALNEGGITETVREQVTYFAVEIASKQMVELRARSSSREELRRMRLSLEPELERRDPDRISPEVRDYFVAVAPSRKQGGEILGNVDLAVSEGKFWNAEAPYRLLTQNSMVVTGPRRVGNAWEAQITMVNLPEEDPEQRISALRERLHGLDVELIETRRMGPTSASSPNTPMFQMIADQVRATYGPSVKTGPFFPPDVTTDSRYLRSMGVQAYGLWPFPVDFYQSTGIHGADERIRLDWFVQGVGFMRTLVARYATSPA